MLLNFYPVPGWGSPAKLTDTTRSYVNNSAAAAVPAPIEGRYTARQAIEAAKSKRPRAPV